MKSFGKMFNKTEEYLAALTLIFVSFLLFIQVVLRYLFGTSIYWAEELARYMIVWLCFLGASMAVRDRKHAVMDLLLNYLGKKTRSIIEIFSAVVCIFFCVAIARLGWSFVASAKNMNSMASTLAIPIFWAYLAVPVGLSLMGIRYTLQLISGIKGLIKKDMSEYQDRREG